MSTSRRKTGLRRRRLYQCLGALGIVWFASAAADGASSAWDVAVEREVGSQLREAVASGRNSAGILVFVRDGQVRIAEGFGVEDANRTPVTATDSRFILNSISKAFVAVALSQLKSRGDIESYDDAANKYLRTYRVPDSGGRAITLEQLATHSAGIDEAVFGMESLQPIPGTPQNADYLAHRPQYFIAPGLVSVYSELGIDLLGLVVADTAKKSYSEYVTEEILKPFGMTNTSVGYPAGTAIPHLVTAYQPAAPQNVEEIIYSTPMTLPDGGVISTGEDMGRFILALTRGPYSDVFQVQRTLDSRSIAYGIVFEITHVRNQLIAYHRGGGRGTECIVAFALAEHAGIFECATTIKPVRGTPTDHQPVSHETLDLAVFDALTPLPGVASPDPNAATVASSASWDAYVGDYVGMSRHHLGIGRLRSLLHPYGVRVEHGAAGLQIDGIDGFHESSPGQFSAAGALETFTFVKSPVDGRILLSRSLDGTPFEIPRPRDNPRLMDPLLALFVAIAATGLAAPYWARLGRDSVAQMAAVALAFTSLCGVVVLYGLHTFGVRYSVGIAWPLWAIRACAFLLIPIAGVLVSSVFLPRLRFGGGRSYALRQSLWVRLHLALLAAAAVAGIGLLVSVGVIGFMTQ